MKLAKQTMSMLTTIDNPFDPFDDFSNWYVYDSQKGYNSCGLLANMAGTSKVYSDDENNSLIEYAIEEIINNNPLKIYTKVTKEVDTAY